MAHISVVIPAYNREHTLGRTLDSVLAQSFDDWRVVIVDDGSADATLRVASGYAGRDHRITVHSQPNAGVSAARNRALDAVDSPWVMFLDADDWLADGALDELSACVAAQPELDLIHGRGVRVMSDGTHVAEPPVPLGEDLFTIFARTCAFSIHTCVVRTELVHAVGGFDESFETCEDWDLWLRVTRTRPRSAAITAPLGFYRIRADSASRAGRRLMEDGCRVIDLGHREDPRLSRWPSPLHPPIDGDRAPAAKLYLATFAAGLATAGGDPDAVLALSPRCLPGQLDGRAVAQTIFTAISEAHADAPARWIDHASERQTSAASVIQTIAERADDPGLPAMAQVELERLVLTNVDTDELPSNRTYGHSQLLRRDIGRASQSLPIQPGISYAVLDPWHQGRSLGSTVLPALDGVVPASVAADAVAYHHAWELLGAFLSGTIYPQLRIQRNDQQLRILRGDVVVGEETLSGGALSGDHVHRVAGWAIFLQELWGRPDLPSAAFYSEDDDERARVTGEKVVEISEPIAAIRVHVGVDIEVHCAGVPLLVLRMEPRDGVISSGRIRRAITQTGRMELCRVAVREALVFSDWSGEATLRERLQARSHARGRAGVDKAAASWARGQIIGRRLSGDVTGASSRVVSLPAALAEEVAVSARARGQVVMTVGSGPKLKGALYDPSLFEPRAIAVHFDLDASEIGQEFENAFAENEDPWEYSSEYEQRKYADTLALIPANRRRAAEIGCAEGMFTQRLAGRVDELTGFDISRRAIERARARCAALTNVRFERLNLFSSALPGRYDLIVCSEILCLVRTMAQLEHAIATIADSLEIGGLLVCTHHTALVDDPSSSGFDWDVIVGAAGIQAALLATGKLILREERRAPTHRAQRYERVVRRPRWRRRGPAARIAEVELPPLKPSLAAHFHVGGGRVRGPSEDGLLLTETTRLPILAYNRVGDGLTPADRRPTVTASALDEQFGRLVAAGFQSATIDEWARADSEARALPGRRIMLTFDAGDHDFADTVLPLLERYELSADLFVISDRVGESAEGDLSARSMDWATLKALPQRWVRIGSGGRSGQILAGLDTTAAMRELLDSRLRLEDELQRAVTTLAYPRGAVDGAVSQLAIASGYDFGFTTGGWAASPGEGHLTLPRIRMRPDRHHRQLTELIAAP
jgi:peptidoglycan/xylan/chitin deacetylase (PgdA/CDA1 family)/2-polyprenyl-3-methyl-5-hydroxy-6-metoxy-1,4-benzoquinol methylase